jgi:8-oxo-dGTP diphosphatase
VETCAKRELDEETGLIPLSIQLGPWTQDVIDEQKHYISLFAIITEFEGEPQLLEPHKCESWDWYLWDELPKPLFPPLASLVKSLGIEKLKEMIESRTCIFDET